MTTKPSAAGAAPAPRRAGPGKGLARLSVVATSAAAFAAAWVAIGHADRQQWTAASAPVTAAALVPLSPLAPQPAVIVVPAAPAPAAVSAAPTAATGSATTAVAPRPAATAAPSAQLVPAPQPAPSAPVRVRRTRAS